MATRAFVDLHCHTRASFDSLAVPAAVVRAAAARGLTHLAITDHGTIDGALAARDAAPDGLHGHRGRGDPHRGRRPDRAVPGDARSRRAVRRGTRSPTSGRRAASWASRIRSTACAARCCAMPGWRSLAPRRSTGSRRTTRASSAERQRAGGRVRARARPAGRRRLRCALHDGRDPPLRQLSRIAARKPWRRSDPPTSAATGSTMRLHARAVQLEQLPNLRHR